MIREIEQNIFSFPIPLPGNPLKWLNCYVIRGGSGGRSLLIDTGFRMKECADALMQGMWELALEYDKTDVLITHLHSDHSGNARLLQQLGCNIRMTREDHQLICRGGWGSENSRYQREGMAPGVLTEIQRKNPALSYAPAPFDADLVRDGDVLSYAGYDMECIQVPGHSPGNLCLYNRSGKIMFTSDHVLFDITPNITAWDGMPDVLGTYLESLQKIYGYDTRVSLPGHRTAGTVFLQERIDQIRCHHQVRLSETYEIVSRCQGMTAYEIAGHMSWNIRTRNWDSFPAGQKWFAVGEALAHLEYLLNRRKIRRESAPDGTHRYVLP